MRILTAFAILAALAAAALPAAALAADCTPPRLIDTIAMKRAARGLAELIPVTINGTPQDFLFDTGGFYTQLVGAAADRLNLPRHPGTTALFDAGGNASRDMVSIHDFAIGQSHSTDTDLVISPNQLPVDGIVALDRLSGMDLEMDFPADTLKLYAQDHCPGQAALPAGAQSLPLTLNRFHAAIPVMLDGHAQLAAIDTGAGSTSITTDVAARIFHLKVGSDDAPEMGVLNGDPNLKVYTHLFDTLQIGGITIKSPNLILIPKAQSGGKDQPAEATPDMILGMDMLRKMHLYLAPGEHKLYLTNAAP